VDPGWDVASGETREGAPTYLHAIYTTQNVCMSVHRMEEIISVLLKTSVVY
jgi:hypothetical protein